MAAEPVVAVRIGDTSIFSVHVMPDRVGKVTKESPRGIYTLASVDLDGKVGETVFDVSIPVRAPRQARKR
jgi:hypothetical protein